MLDRNQIKLADLGGAKRIQNSPAETIVGTPLYMSPEMMKNYFSYINGQTLKTVINTSTDIW